MTDTTLNPDENIMLASVLKWFNPPEFPCDEDKTRRALLLNVILNTIIVALPAVFMAAILGGHFPRLEEILVVIFCAWLIILMARRLMLAGQVALAGTLTVIITYVATDLVLYNLGTIRAAATSFYLLAILIAGLTISRRAIIWMSALCTVTILLFLAAELSGLLPVPHLAVTITQGITFPVSFTLISILLYLAVKSIDEALSRVRTELAERRQAEAALQSSTAHLEILHEMDRALLTAQTHYEIATTALARIRQLIPCLRASVSLFDFGKREACFLAVEMDGPTTMPDTPISFAEFGQRIIDELMQDRPCLIHDALDGVDGTELDLRLAQIGVRSWACLPLLSQGGLLGALNLGRGAGETFTQEEVEIARDIANQLAIAIQQRNLNNALQEELEERKKLIAQLEAINGELERFTYTVSHDLRNPLVTIKGFLGMLEKDLRENQPERIASDMQRISNAADKMQSLLADLLELSRIGRIVNPPSEISLSELAIEAIETLDARIRSKNINVSVALDMPTVYGDRIRLREVFENLIDNAAKYMGDQESPLVEIGVREAEEPVIFVRDNGMGIEHSYKNRIFGLFEKLNPKSEGTGIGLALIKRIIEVHGGKIWVESEGLGRGSTFCFTIPDGRNENA